MIYPNEAPDGFLAVAPKIGCKGCSFLNYDEICTLENFSCYPSERTDGEDVIFIPREQSNLAEFSAIGELAEASAEIERWKSSHDHVCRKFADCENARDENARLCEEAQEEAAKWRSACRDRDDLIAKLKAQLTTALDAIARMR